MMRRFHFFGISLEAYRSDLGWIDMNRLGRWLWWMDREDPRFQHSRLAKLAFAVVWVIGLLFLLMFGQLIINLLARFGLMGRPGP
jgi:hypothetical protein